MKITKNVRAYFYHWQRGEPMWVGTSYLERGPYHINTLWLGPVFVVCVSLHKKVYKVEIS